MNNVLATGIETGDPVREESSFKVSMHTAPHWKMNLMLAIPGPARITIILKNSNNTVLYREVVKKGSRGYWRRFDFKGSEPGAYQFEITDGRQTATRRVDIVNLPAIDAQQYLIYGPQLTP
ncbi:MAG: hypothetical protein H7Z72_12865 [Bacteroidetes bacterium]|nr:hypothetical protein [Fibrella sp.]